MDVHLVLLAGAFAIFIGFISQYLFRRFKAPDVLILIFLGFLFGPGVLGIVDSSMTAAIIGITPYVSAVALAVIMFQAGLDLKVHVVLGSFKKAVAYTVMTFTFSALVTAAVCMVVLGWNLRTAFLLGAILGGTSGAIVIPLVAGLDLAKDTKTILTLEAAITDVLVVAVAMAIIFILQTGQADLLGSAGGIMVTFAVSTIMGVVAGIVWMRILAKLSRQPFSYMITLAAILFVFAFTELLTQKTGGGAIAALVFGIIIANKKEIEEVFMVRDGKFSFDEEIRGFHEQVTFFIRTFFFVYLGIVMATITFEMVHLLLALFVFGGLVAIRYVASILACEYIGLGRTEVSAFFFMMPRGLSAAVVASLPLTLGVVPIETGEMILGISTFVILLSTALASIGAYLVHRGQLAASRSSSAPES
ncbi:MAG: hypothetical protein FJ151_00505 [Euryarchaeota archaeon]|nr:hypothetical protein [Euryarchaeota archaeon]